MKDPTKHGNTEETNDQTSDEVYDEKGDDDMELNRLEENRIEAEGHAEESLGLLGNMYARWTLDSIVELAHAVSLDITKRPMAYANMGYNAASNAFSFSHENG